MDIVESSYEGVHGTTPWSNERPPEISDCKHPWQRIDVTNTAEVLPCCFAQETLGNLADIGLRKVLDGARRGQLQRDVAHGRVNPACFNAPCMYARMSVRRPWKVNFPADRFVHRDRFEDGKIVYDPNVGDGLFVEGPYRYFPYAEMSAVLLFTRLALVPGTSRLRIEVVDESGHQHAAKLFEIASSRHVAISVPFTPQHRQRYRFAIRLWAIAIASPLAFHGMVLRGAPDPHSL